MTELVSMMPWSLDATELISAYRDGSLDPQMVVAGCFARLDQVNPILNAIVASDRAAALDAAAQSASRWRNGTPLGPLDGVPFTVKDNLHAVGLPASWGSRAFSDHVPQNDDLPVARLRAGGAVLLGKTNTPELALAGFTSNSVFGSTGNPWAPERTPGGSSGGAACAVAAGIAPIALGTDAGGSTRRPACHCGCLGLRTSPGAVPRRHGFPALVSDFQTIGLFSRSVADLRLTLEFIADPMPASADDLRGLRVAVIGRIPGHPVDPEIGAHFATAKALLSDLGFDLHEIAAPFDPDDVARLFNILAAAGVARVADGLGTRAEVLTAPIRQLAKSGDTLTAADYVRALDEVVTFRWQIRDFFNAWDVICTPTAAALPWPREVPFPAEIDGTPAGPRASAIYTTFANAAGLPGISVPILPSASGLPIGVQFVGPAGSDFRLAQIASRIEALAPWRKLAELPGVLPHVP